jgi:branched-chain amino acid transport system ATP-binding protein
MTEVLLEARGIGKRFGGVQALKDVSLTIRRGEIYGLIGPNGAGKTTLFNVFTGLYPRDNGEVSFDRRALATRQPAHRRRRRHRPHLPEHPPLRQHDGTERTSWSAATCAPGRRVRRHPAHPRRRAEEAGIRRRADELLHYVGIADRADDLARNLSYGDQRRLEIARALATEPQLLALDEPAAGMNATETAGLRELIEGLRRDGITVLLIEHDVKLVMGLCDRVAVLDHGEKIAEDVPDVVRANPKVIEAYLGTSH